jgi:calcineurin-like phosphoesterase family protein/2'-5' RNA ligase
MGILDLFKKKEQPHRQKRYLIEFRLSGYAKYTIIKLRSSIEKNFDLEKDRKPPHITLVGELETDDEKQLVKQVVEACKQYKLIRFKLDGIGSFPKPVIYAGVKQSTELEDLRLDLVKRLKPFCMLKNIDLDPVFVYHITIVMNGIERKFERIWKYLQSWKIPKMNQYLLRATILNEDRRILCEYDLILEKLLSREEALDKKIFSKTMDKFNKIRETSEIEFEDVSDKEKIYVFSDTHFDHTNIIRYCNRPFNSTRQMNDGLVGNWNTTVRDIDTIYFLGDMAYGRNRRPIDYWLGKLGGEVFYIRGNHDSDEITRATVIPNRYGIQFGNYKFLLMHDPYRPLGYDGWIIHGDKHNNHLNEYPLINQKNKTVNVSSELIHYTPLSLEKIISLIETGHSFKTLDG